MTAAFVSLLASALVPQQLQVGTAAGDGAFGVVRWAQYAGTSAVAKRAKENDDKAAAYLRVEEHANTLLRDHHGETGSNHLAPYLGACEKDGSHTLVWTKCGSLTLGEYLQRGQAGLTALAEALGCARDELPKVVIRQQLEALAQVKPDNWLVDAAASTLRLIDFGSSCDVGAWLTQRGYQPDRVPCSVLYMPPEQLVTAKSPYTYDVYSAALVWLCIAIPALGESEEALFALRMQLKAVRHDLGAWRATWPYGVSPLDGWQESVFGAAASAPLGSEFEHEHAWQLLAALLAIEPSERATAAEALLSPYLNADCSIGSAPMPAPRPWTFEALVAQTGAAPRRLVSDECELV